MQDLCSGRVLRWPPPAGGGVARIAAFRRHFLQVGVKDGGMRGQVDGERGKNTPRVSVCRRSAASFGFQRQQFPERTDTEHPRLAALAVPPYRRE